MRKRGLCAIFLAILIVSLSVMPVLAADVADDDPDSSFTESAQPSPPAPPDDTSDGDTATVPPSEPDDPVSEPPADSVEPTETPAAEPSEDPVTSAEPTDEPSSEPTERPAPTAEPTNPPAETAAPAAPTLEMSAGQTIYLNQETPAVKIRWQAGIPDNVAGYVWSVGDGSSRQVFYVTYDARSATLAAGALNGHINEAGTYSIECQPVDSEQLPATPAAAITLRVQESACELTITASESLPVAAGSELTLTADAGSLADEVTKYEWKPAGSGSGSRTCRISEVSAGPVRYTCTAVLGSGQRITGTIVVTGTELIAAQRNITLGASSSAPSLSVAWSNGTPDGSLRYRWSVRGESTVDLSNRGGTALEASALGDLPSRDNPYTVSCQAYSGSAPMGSPATFQVRVTGDGVKSDAARTARTIVGDEYGRVPNTDDTDSAAPSMALCLTGSTAAIWLAMRRRSDV